MRWKTGRRSSNVEDRRSARKKPLAIGGLGTLVIIGLALFMGVDPGQLLQVVNEVQAPQTSTRAPSSPANDEMSQFVSVVLADTEDTWHALFKQAGARYREPKLVLFSGSVQSACGFAQAAMGPFYCPSDEKVYLDFSFFKDMERRLGAPGDFAQAYVIAHEVGHHVQNLTGILPKVQKLRRSSSKTKANQLSVRLELQADCLAGIWAHNADRTRNLLETGDLEEALNAATAIGDDRLQKQSQGYVIPDSFTHGTSAQRKRWFATGYKYGDFGRCDTFKTNRL